MARPTDPHHNEARWPVLIALAGLGGCGLALPTPLVVGPRWLVPGLVAGMIALTAWAHAAHHHRLDRVLGYAISVFVTLALIGSLVLLIRSLPDKAQPPHVLLRSAALLWITNFVVFALWYWRLDAGGPHERAERGAHEAGAFFFPQMMHNAPDAGGGPWFPNFVDYLFLAFSTSTTLGPTDTAVLSRWAKVLTMVQAGISLLCVVVLVSRAVASL